MKNITSVMIISGLMIALSLPPVFAGNRVPASKGTNQNQIHQKTFDAPRDKKTGPRNRVPASKREPENEMRFEPSKVESNKRKIISNRVPSSKKMSPEALNVIGKTQ